MVRPPRSTSAIEQISAADARQLALRAQGLWDALPSRASAAAKLPALTSQLGAVQLDTISVLARSHQLVANARLGALSRAEIESNYWSNSKPTHFEYWSHAACILPIASWPLFEFRRESYRARGLRWHTVSKSKLQEVLKHIQNEGAVTTSDVGGGRKDAQWWNWSDSKVALEWLLDIGEIACTRRVGWRRTYDLTERVVPAKFRKTMTEEKALFTLLNQALDTLGVGTRADIWDVHRLRNGQNYANSLQQAWQQFLAQPDLQEVRVEGWNEIGYARTAALESLKRGSGKRNVMLSPFDSLIWFRPRLERMFGMEYRIEAYTPAAKRTFGYFAMPVLAGDQLIARVDPNKTSAAMRVVKVTFEMEKPTAENIQAVANAVAEAARWISVEKVEIDACIPTVALRPLRQALNSVGMR